MIKLDRRDSITNADFLVTVANLSGYFSKFSGIKKKFSRSTYSDGLSNIKRVAQSGAIEFEPITISKAFDPIQDDALITWLTQHECGELFDVTVTPIKRCNGIEKRGTKAWYLSNCRVMEYDAATDTDTGDGSKSSDIIIVLSFDWCEWAGSNNQTVTNFSGI